MNSLGQLINTISSKGEANLSITLPNEVGVYLLNIITSQGASQKRVIKQ